MISLPRRRPLFVLALTLLCASAAGAPADAVAPAQGAGAVVVECDKGGAAAVPCAWPSFPTPPNGLPGTITGNGSYTTGIIVAYGATKLSAAATLSQAGTLSIQRYVDLAGTIAIGAAITQAMSAATPATVAVNDGLPFAAFAVTIVNGSGSSGTVTNFAIASQ